MSSRRLKVLNRLLRNALASLYHSSSRNLENKYLLGVTAIKSQRSCYPNLSDIRQAEVRVFSQNGEDGILDFIFEQLQLIKPNILEIGVGDFTECNSKFANFFRSAGVYLLDSDKGLSQIYERYRSRRINSRFFFEQTWIDTANAKEIFSRAKSKLATIDVLSIDIDGNDFWVLREIPLDGVQVIIVEYNPSLSDSKPITVVYDPSFDRTKKHYSWKYYGATLEAFQDLLEGRGFSFIGATSQGTNAFFVKSDFVNLFRKVIKNTSEYKNLDSREARNQEGALSFIDIRSEREILKDLPFVDVQKID